MIRDDVQGWSEDLSEVEQRVHAVMRLAGYAASDYHIVQIFKTRGTLTDAWCKDVYDPGGMLVVVEHFPRSELTSAEVPLHRQTRIILVGFPAGSPELWILGTT